ncbi:hypothetical protein HMPREF9134_00719 [Porphyromonas catoniae F0037]|uniref:Uncharacterized protein n=1 Tax=Porphyromonas catoniae F0037 TaxID=1127696 RepID=L1NFC8_9PORP|nr:hypothetical protein HMPREF9134_00719 [Porphyromonas catoniae F0037]
MPLAPSFWNLCSCPRVALPIPLLSMGCLRGVQRETSTDESPTESIHGENSYLGYRYSCLSSGILNHTPPSASPRSPPSALSGQVAPVWHEAVISCLCTP